MTKKIRAIIIDDEPLSREKIKLLIKDHLDFEIIAEGKDANEAKKLIDKFNPELIFLDIKMPDQSGIEFLASLSDNAPYVIFTTAFSEFALGAIELNAVHYLLKPFDREKFYDAIERARERILNKFSRELLGKLNTEINSGRKPDKFFDKIPVKLNKKIVLIPVSKICYLQADKNYVIIHDENSEYRIRKTFRQIQKKLDPSKFLRVHKSYIVNIDFIKEFEPVFNQEYIIKLNSGKKIPTGLTYKGEIKKLIN